MLSAHVNGIDIAFQDAGAGDPIVFINGTAESGRTWRRQAERLAGRYRCITIDNRDTGESAYVEAPYTPRDLAADAAGVIDALGLGSCHVVGYSLGGATAQELALARPDLVRSVVLLSTWPASDGWFVAQMRNWQAIRRAHWDDEGAWLRALSPWLFAPRSFADGTVQATAEFWAETEIAPQRPEGFIRQTEADIAHDARARLGDVAAPALVVVGADDVCTPPRYAHALHALLDDVSMVEIPDAAHCAVFERPDDVTRAIEGFLVTR